MKKTVTRSMRPHILLIFFSNILLAHLSSAQDCNTRAATKPFTLERSTEVYHDFTTYSQKPAKWDVSKMKEQLIKVETWLKGQLEGYTGAKLLYYNTYNVLDFVPGKDLLNAKGLAFYEATGIKRSCSGKMMFFAYYCYDNSNIIHTQGESGSNVQVGFNDVFTYGLTQSTGVYSINGKQAFKILEKKHSLGRIDFYEERSQDNATAKMYTANDFIIIRKSDNPVFISFTRREYLQQMLKNLEDYKINEVAAAKLAYTPASEAANKERFDEELKRIDNSKSYTKEQMAPYRKRFIETWETEKQKFDRRMSEIDSESIGAKEVMLEYMKKPTEWLNRSFNDFYSGSNYSALAVKQFLDNLDKSYVSEGEEPDTGTEVAFLNPAYFNTKLSGDVPQLIILHVRNSGLAHMLDVASRIKKPGALASLEAMLTEGN